VVVIVIPVGVLVVMLGVLALIISVVLVVVMVLVLTSLVFLLATVVVPVLEATVRPHTVLERVGLPVPHLECFAPDLRALGLARLDCNVVRRLATSITFVGDCCGGRGQQSGERNRQEHPSHDFLPSLV
jgi:hypothetical protein